MDWECVAIKSFAVILSSFNMFWVPMRSFSNIVKFYDCHKNWKLLENLKRTRRLF